jgi:hypothetical protein
MRRGREGLRQASPKLPDPKKKFHISPRLAPMPLPAGTAWGLTAQFVPATRAEDDEFLSNLPLSTSRICLKPVLRQTARQSSL